MRLAGVSLFLAAVWFAGCSAASSAGRPPSTRPAAARRRPVPGLERGRRRQVHRPAPTRGAARAEMGFLGGTAARVRLLRDDFPADAPGGERPARAEPV